MGPGRARARCPRPGGRSVTPIWPPVGLAVALTYIGGYRLLPGIVLGSLALGLSYNAWPLALLLALAQVVQPVVDVRIMKALDFDPKLERVRDPIILSLVAGPAGSFLAALLAVSLYFLFGVRTDRGAAVRLHVVVAARLARRDGDGAADLRVGLRPLDGVDVAARRRSRRAVADAVRRARS